MGCCETRFLPETEYFKSNEQIKVYLSDKNDIIYEPLNIKKRIGVIVYPGATANNKHYAEIGYNLCKNGYFTVLCKMPCNLASFSSDRAADIAKSYLSYADIWILGGHSLGNLIFIYFLLTLT